MSQLSGSWNMWAAHEPTLLPLSVALSAVAGGVRVCAALKRKGKGDDVAEQQMDAVVRAHNGEGKSQGGPWAQQQQTSLSSSCVLDDSSHHSAANSRARP